MRVLLVEDDSELARELATGLTNLGITVVRAGATREARRQLSTHNVDVIILDVMLPNESGFAFCRALRRDGSNIPILMLTARDSVEDRVEGLDSGADDYLTKPFALQELSARLRALARRRSLLSRSVQIADLEIDLGAKRAKRGGAVIELTAKEFALLECLALSPNVVLPRAVIAAHVWDENHDFFENVLDVLVARLRRKIDTGFQQRLIHTMRGVGYRLGT